MSSKEERCLAAVQRLAKAKETRGLLFLDQDLSAQELAQPTSSQARAFLKAFESQGRENLGQELHWAQLRTDGNRWEWVNRKSADEAAAKSEVSSDSFTSNSHHLDFEELKAALKTRMKDLTADERKIIRLYFFGKSEISLREIAEKLKASLNTVKTRYCRALAKLRKDPVLEEYFVQFRDGD